MTTQEKNIKRAELDAMAEKAIAGLIEQDATLQQKIDDSPGYAVANMKVTKVPIVGAGGGEGVYVDNKTKEHVYFTVSRFDIGGGWGARSYKVLLLIESQEMMERVKGGVWEFAAGVEASAGTASAEGGSGDLTEGYRTCIV